MRSAQVAQGVVELGLEALQDWRLHNLSGESLPMLDCPNGLAAFLTCQTDNSLP